MNETVPTIAEIGYRFTECITSSPIFSTCPITGAMRPADEMTKSKPNRILEESIQTNTLKTPPKRVFMLQNALFRHARYIPTASVSMPGDRHKR